MRFTIILLGILTILSLSYSDTLYRYLKVPKGQTYTGLEYYSDDFSIYAGIIKYGIKGGWGWMDLHTSETFAPVPIHFVYSLWGHIVSLFGLTNAGVAYHLLRFFGSVLLLFSISKFLNLLLPPQMRQIAWILVLFSTGIPRLASIPGGVEFLPIYDWLTEFNPFYRFAALPHYLLGNSLLLLASVSLIRNRLLPFTLFAFLSAAIHPISFIFLAIITLVFSGYKLLAGKKRFILFPATLSIFGGSILIYFHRLINTPPWNHMAAWESGSSYGLRFGEFALALGLTLPFSFSNYLLETTRKKISIASIICATWIFSFLVLSLKLQTLGISNVRFLQSFIFIPLAITSTPAIWRLSRILGKNLRLPAHILNFTLVLLLLLPSFLTYPYSLRYKLTLYPFKFDTAFPYADYTDAYSWLDKNSSPKDTVICLNVCGHHVPFFAATKVYLGHKWATINYQPKNELAVAFFSNQMTPGEAREFLNGNKINLVFSGYVEKYYGNLTKYSSLLQTAYENPSVSISKVRPI